MIQRLGHELDRKFLPRSALAFVALSKYCPCLSLEVNVFTDCKLKEWSHSLGTYL